MHIPPPPEMTCGFLIQLVFCPKKTMWFIGVEVEQETSAPPPKKNPGSAPGICFQSQHIFILCMGISGYSPETTLKMQMVY